MQGAVLDLAAGFSVEDLLAVAGYCAQLLGEPELAEQFSLAMSARAAKEPGVLGKVLMAVSMVAGPCTCETCDKTIVTLLTPLIGQRKSQWCWAASSLMIAKTSTLTFATQTGIVVEIKGSNVDEGGTISEVVRAIKFASNKK